MSDIDKFLTAKLRSRNTTCNPLKLPTEYLCQNCLHHHDIRLGLLINRITPKLRCTRQWNLCNHSYARKR